MGGRRRNNKSLHRRRPSREPYDVVLIVCEGGKTEPDYFEALKREFHLSNANVRVCGRECGSAPMSVVEYAIEQYRINREYDKVYCVFDKDQHETYDDALRKARDTKLRGKVKIKAITSVPCFEYWLLLHFEDTTRPYAPSGNRSPCDNAVVKLKRHMPDYEKGDTDIFSLTFPYIDEAIRRAELIEKRQAEAGTDNPSTKGHHLVQYLRDLKTENI